MHWIFVYEDVFRGKIANYTIVHLNVESGIDITRPCKTLECGTFLSFGHTKPDNRIREIKS